MSALDRVLASLAPGVAVRRARARMQLAVLERGARAMYDGASVSRRTAGWRRVASDANGAAQGGALDRLRETSRDLVRNNPFAAHGVQVIAHNVVGGGIIPQFHAGKPRLTAQVEALAMAHLDSPSIDAAGQHDLYGLQNQIMKAVAESGEALVRRRWRKAKDGLPLPFQMQVLEADFLDTSRAGPLGNNRIIQGVEFDPVGRRVAYWLFDEHPAATGTYRLLQSRRIPASEVAHVYRIERPGQVRGVPWLAPVMLRLRDFDDYEDAQLVRQKIAAVFSVFITDAEGLAGNGMGVGLSGEQGRGAASLKDELLEPGLIAELPAGKDVRFAEPPGVQGYGEYVKTQLHAIAVGLGITYESLTGDFSQVNFSSARMGWLEFQRALGCWQRDIMINQLCRPVERWFLEAAAVGLGLSGPVSATWTPPRREMINPAEEIPAIRDAVRSGLLSLSEAVRREGCDPAKHFAELAADMETLNQLGLILDVDPARVSRAGVTQSRSSGQSSQDKNPEEQTPET